MKSHIFHRLAINKSYEFILCQKSTLPYHFLRTTAIKVTTVILEMRFKL